MSDENDSYTEVTSTSWFSRLGDSFRGIGIGIILIIAAVVAALRAASGQTVDNWIDPGYQWVDRNNIDVEENKKYLYL